MIRIAIITAVLVSRDYGALDAQTLICSTYPGHPATCQGPGGYVSHEWDRDGMRFGDDNQGDRWSTSRWMDTTVHHGHAAWALTLGREAR